MKNFIDAKSLLKNYKKYIIIDCRGQLMDNTYGVKSYEESRLPGAFFMDMDTDLSGPVGAHGGRHPLPDMKVFTQKVASFGITKDSAVVVYDDWIFASARLVWMLKYIGVNNVKVLLGGINAWKENAGELETGTPSASVINDSTKQESLVQELLAYKNEVTPQIPMASVVDVQGIIANGSHTLVDVRGRSRYLGHVEPLDRVPGHIPTALNVCYEGCYTADGLQPLDTIKELFKEVSERDQAPVVYCGSGISAPVAMLAMEEIGLSPILYLGSYSDWISYAENPIATEESQN